jgi:uncharacterized coiled-coil DUF342 family protein
MIKTSTDPEVQKLKVEIDLLKRQRSEFVAKMRESQYRLNYKVAEKAAIAKLIELEKQKAKASQGREALSKLKRMRHSIEFKISTESLSLAQEKSMVRKINELNAQIDESLKLERLERKRGLVGSDIETYQKALESVVKSITETDAKLDVLYSGIRKALGIRKRRPKEAQQQQARGAPRPQQKQNQEINLEDIVIIKKKEGKQPASQPAA